MQMREVKFRAFIKQLKMVVPVTDLYFECKEIECDLTSGKGETSVFSINEIELMQYTCLKDKNGKEIFEGDVVITDEADGLDQIIYYKGAFYIESLSNRNFGDELLSDLIVEVIGNIYENPELLEK